VDPNIEKGWELVKREKDLVLYQKEVPGSDVVAFRGEGTLEAPIARVASVLLDGARAPEWVGNLVESRLLRRVSPFEFVEYDHIGTPFVMKDRDFVARAKMEVDAKNRMLTLDYKSVEDPAAPTTSYVRGDLIRSQFQLTSLEDGSKTQLIAELHADPKGSVPKWIVNFFQRSWPSDTFRGIQNQLRKPDIQVPATFADVISLLKF
jgi:hypothetical protein